MSIAPISYQPQQAFSGGADFSQLAGLGDVYKKSRNEKRLSDLGAQLASGSIDYRQAAGQVADMGDIGSTLKFLALAEQQRKEGLITSATAKNNEMLFGSPGGGPPSASSTIAGPPSTRVDPAPGLVPNAAADDDALPPPRVPVPSSPTVVGTAEGVARGLYPPERTAAAPVAAQPAPAPAPPAPDFNARFDAARPTGAPPSLANSVPTMAHMPALMSVYSNQYSSDAQKDFAKAAIAEVWKNAKPTEKIQTLQALRDDPKLLEIEKDLRRAQKTDVNIHPGEKKQDEELGKTLGEMHSGYIKDALKVPATKATLDAAERAMGQPGFVSGSAAPAVKAAQRAGVALGLLDAETASPGELFSKLQNKAIMDAGGSGSGLGPQISNNDAKIIRDSTFNETNTPAGNRKIIGFLRLTEDRKVDYAREMNRYAKAHGGRIDIDVTDHMAKWAENNPLDFTKVPGFDPKAVSVTGAGTHKNVPFKLEPD